MNVCQGCVPKGAYSTLGQTADLLSLWERERKGENVELEKKRWNREVVLYNIRCLKGEVETCGPYPGTEEEQTRDIEWFKEELKKFI